MYISCYLSPGNPGRPLTPLRPQRHLDQWRFTMGRYVCTCIICIDVYYESVCFNRDVDVDVVLLFTFMVFLLFGVCRSNRR